jgi:hypothetical protein
MSPPINRATDPVSRAQMRLEYRLINLLGESRYGEVQPLLQALLHAKEDAPAAASLIRKRNPWEHVEVHHHYHLSNVNAN